ncbi:MAG: GGDEF domain-containing protein [Burkholderiales bacterium]|nr:GGDEF domain-containing protein [Burkholderiales bacterium]
MLALHRTPLCITLLAFVLITALFATLGATKGAAEWKFLDIVGEGGIALLAGICLVMMWASRPAGPVTSLLTIGLAGIMLGAWTDCLDEFFKVGANQSWDSWLEAVLMLGGAITLTVGLYFYRFEQLSLNAHLEKRERLFRDHRAFDRVTQVANADYLRRQLRAETAPGREPAALVLLDLDRFHLVNRAHGPAEGDRVLQGVTQLLLLNVRTGDLVCRYAGDRFAVLLPATTPQRAMRLAEHLRRVIEQWRHHPRDGTPPLALCARQASCRVEGDVDALLSNLDRMLDESSNTRVPHRAVHSAHA